MRSGRAPELDPLQVESKGGPQYRVAAMIEDFEPLDTENLPRA